MADIYTNCPFAINNPARSGRAGTSRAVANTLCFDGYLFEGGSDRYGMSHISQSSNGKSRCAKFGVPSKCSCGTAGLSRNAVPANTLIINGHLSNVAVTVIVCFIIYNRRKVSNPDVLHLFLSRLSNQMLTRRNSRQNPE